jgi:Ca-activated chloride channel family protein
MDTSGSMSGAKIASARTSLIRFIELLDDRDRLQVMLFSDEMVELAPLAFLGDSREDITRRVSGVIEGGDTRLYDAVLMAYDELGDSGDPDHIRAIVVLSDGEDTASNLEFDQLIGQVGNLSEGGTATKIFTIAFGGDADRDVLGAIADSTGGKLYTGDPDTISQVYAEIATFF